MLTRGVSARRKWQRNQRGMGGISSVKQAAKIGNGGAAYNGINQWRKRQYSNQKARQLVTAAWRRRRGGMSGNGVNSGAARRANGVARRLASANGGESGVSAAASVAAYGGELSASASKIMAKRHHGISEVMKTMAANHEKRQSESGESRQHNWRNAAAYMAAKRLAAAAENNGGIISQYQNESGYSQLAIERNQA